MFELSDTSRGSDTACRTLLPLNTSNSDTETPSLIDIRVCNLTVDIGISTNPEKAVIVLRTTQPRLHSHATTSMQP
jgi:hypothetical protein